MTDVQIYHYQKPQKADKHSVRDAGSWMMGLVAPFDTGRSIIHTEYELYRQAYNTFQRSDAPNWQKIAAGFLSDYSVVLDEDRPKVTEALIYASSFADQKYPVLSEVAQKITTLGKGPIVVKTSMVTEHFPDRRKVHLAALKKDLQQYKTNPHPNKLEKLLEKHEYYSPVPEKDIYKLFQRAVLTPRIW